MIAFKFQNLLTFGNILFQEKYWASNFWKNATLLGTM